VQRNAGNFHAEDAAGGRTGRRWAAPIAFASGCFLYWAIYAAAILLTSKLSFWGAARGALLGILPDCLLAPFALQLTRRVPWGRAPAWRFLLWHAAGGAVFMLLSGAGYAIEHTIEQRLTTGVWGSPPAIAMLAWKGLGSSL